MSPKSAKKPKPEDMLLRVIRVAEILSKGHGKTSEKTPSDELDPQTSRADTSAIRIQKTQT